LTPSAQTGGTMFTYTRKDLIHWNYYIALERDLENISRFIEFSSENETTYSIELAKLLMAASSEVDVVLKMLCKIKGVNAENINEYRDCVKLHYSEMINEEIYLDRFSMTSKPWINWDLSGGINPDWWKSYNNVKHERNINYSQANTKNTINAVGALLIVLIYYYKNKDNLSFKDVTRALNPHSSLINLKEEYYNAVLITE
jgi:hypothetical protein